MAILRSSRVAVLLSFALALAACGGSETPEQTDHTSQASQPAADDAAAWRSWMSASTQSPWQGEFVSNWDDEAAQEGSFVLLAPDSFYVQTSTALRQHSPEGQAASQRIDVAVTCDGQELRILLPAVVGAGPTLATLPAHRLGALEEIDPLGPAGLFRPDSLSPWHLLQRTLDYGDARSSARDNQVQQLALEVPPGTLARFPKDQAVQATLLLDHENGSPQQLTLASSNHTLVVTFADLQRIQDVESARANLTLTIPEDASTLLLEPIVDAEIAAAEATRLDQLGY